MASFLAQMVNLEELTLIGPDDKTNSVIAKSSFDKVLATLPASLRTLTIINTQRRDLSTIGWELLKNLPNLKRFEFLSHSLFEARHFEAFIKPVFQMERLEHFALSLYYKRAIPEWPEIPSQMKTLRLEDFSFIGSYINDISQLLPSVNNNVSLPARYGFAKHV